MMKMMLKRLYIAIALVALNIMPMQAQTMTQTHAEATSQKWKGIDVNTVLGHSEYKEATHNASYVEKGFKILLYNVGTGCFVIQGGKWGIEGRLFHRDFGREMYLYSSGRINSGVTEANIGSDKNSYSPNIPLVTRSADWNKATDYCFTTIMDGNRNIGGTERHYEFVRVEDPSNTDTYTYYMYETLSANGKPAKNYYLGAVWGEWHVPEAQGGKGDGQFVFLDDDGTCWTTGEVEGVTTKYRLENGDEVELQKLYQWRLISEEEFLNVLTSDEVGLNPSISSLIPDRDFTRNSDDFHGFWVTSEKKDFEYDNTKDRYAYTWGNYAKNINQQKLEPKVRVGEPWNKPIQLKESFDQNGTNADRMKNSKYGFMSFEGVGTVYTNFQVPRPGWYLLECAGFSQGHDAYMFARVIDDADVDTPEKNLAVFSKNEPHYGKVTLERLPNEALNTTFSKNNNSNCMAAGEELTKNSDNHKQAVWVCVSDEDFGNEGDANRTRTIRVGFGKDEATISSRQSSKYTPEGETETTLYGYYDTDWVCVDDIRASYMGLAPVFFYDDEEDLNYLSYALEDREKLESNEYVSATLDGRYAGAANLQRSFKKDMWNTFSFPLPLTGEQVRNAFGDNSVLLKLNSIGGLSNNDCIIDFETVNLVTLDNVVTAGNLYMLKPTKDPIYGLNPRGDMKDYYDLGKMFFSTVAADREDPNYKYPVIDLSICTGNQPVGSYNDKNDGAGHVSYIRTPSYSKFRVDSSGEVIRQSKTGYDLGIVNNTYAPKGSYVMSNDKMYEINRDTPLKGFRGWITLTHSIFDDTTQAAQGAKIAINGVIDGEDPIATSIDQHLAQPVNVRAIAGVYDLMGRKVGDTIENLPKGLYIVSGKKLLVK